MEMFKSRVPAITALCLASLLCVMPATLHAGPPCKDYEDCLRLYVPVVKEARASALDPSLPDISFDKWLKDTLGTGAEITWDVNDCGERPEHADPDEDYPVCVGVDARLADGGSVILNFIVGTDKQGVTGKPELFYSSPDLHRLSDLPELLKKVSPKRS